MAIFDFVQYWTEWQKREEGDQKNQQNIITEQMDDPLPKK